MCISYVFQAGEVEMEEQWNGIRMKQALWGRPLVLRVYDVLAGKN